MLILMYSTEDELLESELQPIKKVEIKRAIVIIFFMVIILGLIY